MLKGLPRGRYEDRVFRLAGGWAVKKFAEKRGLTEEELAKVLARTGGEVPDFLDGPFTVLEEPLGAGVGPYGFRTRFSDGSFPVFYASKTPETSELEIKHHCEKDAIENPPKRALPRKYCVFGCDLRAGVIDLQPLHEADPAWATLTSLDTEDSMCLDVGREAAAANDFEALLAPSARHRGGTTTPTFKRPVLSNAVVEKWVRFVFEDATGKAKMEAA